jgi:protein involved in polysaccharide export with SLBB domain
MPWTRDTNPTWTYIPLPSVNKPKGFPAEVALPEWHYTTNRIRIFVGGMVKSPGEHSVPENCTVLEAIGYAGGFFPGAYTSRIRLTSASGSYVQLRLASKRTWLLGHKRVWYRPAAGQDLSRRTSPPAADTDFVLQDDDVIHLRGVD